MKSVVSLILLCSISANIFGAYGYNGSTTAAVTLAGSIIKSKYVDNSAKKYKRKDCPVCKGQGWYWSGDKIKKVDCGYCEPEVKQIIQYPSTGFNNNIECINGRCRVIQK